MVTFCVFTELIAPKWRTLLFIRHSPILVFRKKLFVQSPVALNLRVICRPQAKSTVQTKLLAKIFCKFRFHIHFDPSCYHRHLGKFHRVCYWSHVQPAHTIELFYITWSVSFCTECTIRPRDIFTEISHQTTRSKTSAIIGITEDWKHGVELKRQEKRRNQRRKLEEEHAQR